MVVAGAPDGVKGALGMPPPCLITFGEVDLVGDECLRVEEGVAGGGASSWCCVGGGCSGLLLFRRCDVDEADAVDADETARPLVGFSVPASSADTSSTNLACTFFMVNRKWGCQAFCNKS